VNEYAAKRLSPCNEGWETRGTPLSDRAIQYEVWRQGNFELEAGAYTRSLQLNVSAFYGIGDAFRGCVGGVSGVSGSQRGCVGCQKHLRLS
jgi:hypothetical protein